MCEECPENVRKLAKRIHEILESSGGVVVGGLHIVIEDENVETEHIQWCIDTQKLIKRDEELARALLEMPLPSRHMAVQMAQEYHQYQ